MTRQLPAGDRPGQLLGPRAGRAGLCRRRVGKWPARRDLGVTPVLTWRVTALGRTEETYGEDPYLVAQIGLAAVRRSAR